LTISVTFSSLRSQPVSQVGLDVAGIRCDLAGHSYAARIERDVREGIRNGVNATPKFYVNGKRIEGAFSLEGLVDAVRAAVTAASAARAGLAVAGLLGLLEDDARELDA